LAVKRVQEEGEVAGANAETEASVLIRRAQADAQATRSRAEAERARLMAESEGRAALIKAENSRTENLMHLELERYRLDKMPEIVAQMMKPAEKIDSIRIHQVSGFGGSTQLANGAGPGSGGADASKPPMTQVMDSILGMALQLPALKSIGESIGVDLSGAVAPAPAASASSSPGKKT
jgi:uncharacterized membrane protein YqiK